jgi:hypothetical protein
MACSLSKRSTRMARGMNPTVSGHHPPVKHRKPPVRLCLLCPADSPGPIYGLTPFRAASDTSGHAKNQIPISSALALSPTHQRVNFKYVFRDPFTVALSLSFNRSP